MQVNAFATNASTLSINENTKENVATKKGRSGIV